jgi:hypothetical protein
MKNGPKPLQDAGYRPADKPRRRTDEAFNPLKLLTLSQLA